MATGLSIGLYHPSEIIFPSVLDINQLGFITASQQCFANQLKEFYPDITKPIRSYVVGLDQIKNGVDDLINLLPRVNYLPALKDHVRQKHSVQIVFNELFGIGGNLKARTTENDLFLVIDMIIKLFNNPEIIFNEMNTYRVTQYTGNGLQNNGVLNFIRRAKEKFPDGKFSLGIQTIGNKLCSDLIMITLPILLSHVKNLEWFTYPIHFTEVGYYHDPYAPQQQIKFLDAIREIAIENDVSSLCYIYPWDRDYFHLPGQPRNAFCGIWDEEWNVKYDILRNIGN